MGAAIPTQRQHPACDWPAEQRRGWVQWNFCPCGVRIGFNEAHCADDACRHAHLLAEQLLDLNEDNSHD